MLRYAICEVNINSNYVYLCIYFCRVALLSSKLGEMSFVYTSCNCHANIFLFTIFTFFFSFLK